MAKKEKYRSLDDHPYWETVKQLPTFQAKVEYTLENWWIPMAGVAILIIIIVSVIIANFVNNVPTYLTGAYVNIYHSDTAPETPSDYLDRTFLHEELGIPEDERLTMRCVTNMVLDLSGESVVAESTYNTITRLDAMIPSGELDYFLMTSDLVKGLYDRYGEPFLDLRTFLTAEELELYADRLHYTKDGIPVGIDISDSTLLKDMYFSSDKTVCFVWFNFVKKTDNMRPFFDFVMNTLP